MISILFSIMINISSPGFILDEAEALIENGKIDQSIELLESALKTTEFNTFARTEIYWSLYMSYDYIGKYDQAADKLLMFIESSNSIKEAAESELDTKIQFFIEKSRLITRTEYAKSLMEIYWSKYNINNCKTAMFHCALPDDKLIGLYHIRMPFCGDPKKVISINKTINNYLTNIDVLCENKEIEKYYFR